MLAVANITGRNLYIWDVSGSTCDAGQVGFILVFPHDDVQVPELDERVPIEIVYRKNNHFDAVVPRLGHQLKHALASVTLYHALRRYAVHRHAVVQADSDAGRDRHWFIFPPSELTLVLASLKVVIGSWFFASEVPVAPPRRVLPFSTCAHTPSFSGTYAAAVRLGVSNVTASGSVRASGNTKLVIPSVRGALPAVIEPVSRIAPRSGTIAPRSAAIAPIVERMVYNIDTSDETIQPYRDARTSRNSRLRDDWILTRSARAGDG
jgi:hypothetical protein